MKNNWESIILVAAASAFFVAFLMYQDANQTIGEKQNIIDAQENQIEALEKENVSLRDKVWSLNNHLMKNQGE